MPLPPHVLFPLVQVAAIVSGTPTGGFPGTVAVGAVRGSQGAIFCSGTVVAERFVLTAAHCIEDAQPFEDAGYTLEVFSGDDLLRTGFVERAAWVGTTGWAEASPSWASAGRRPGEATRA